MEYEFEDSDENDMFITPQSVCNSSQLPEFGLNDIEELLHVGEIEQQNTAEIVRPVEEEDFRFSEPLNESEVAVKVKQSVPKSSLYKDAWAVMMFEEWRYEKNLRVGDSEVCDATSKLERTLPDEMTDLDNVKETNAAEKESAFNDLGNQIMEDVALVHPIFYDSYNLCELIASLKLAKFSIQMLQNICEYFDIPSQDIKSRRKAPYIERIVAFARPV
ncbi:hypothetical protein QZH41_005618 [Actinostola sp. cb2023]|nr:hypothetical protein QZH41_005618 [Actinostola sp. cb2023]